MTRYRPILALTLSLAGVIPAQQALLTPVPVLPKGGAVPDSLADETVFFDAANGEILVSYPDPQNAGQRRALRLGKHNLVEPAVTSAVSMQSDGRYQYAYSLQNGANSHKSIATFSVLTANDKTISATHPVWAVTSMPAAGTRPGTIHPETQVAWSTQVNGELQPLGAAAGFSIKSAYRPGISVSYSQNRADAEYTAAIASSLPNDVKSKLAIAFSPQWDAAQAIVIAPRYGPGVPRELVAGDFHRWLKQLSAVDTLKPDSPFVTGAISALTSYLQTPGAAVLQPNLGFLSAASPGLESEIASAMRSSLQ